MGPSLSMLDWTVSFFDLLCCPPLIGPSLHCDDFRFRGVEVARLYIAGARRYKLSSYIFKGLAFDGSEPVRVPLFPL